LLPSRSRSPRASRFKIRCSVSVLHPQLVADRQWLLVLRLQESSILGPQSPSQSKEQVDPICLYPRNSFAIRVAINLTAMLFPDLAGRVVAIRERIAAAVERGGHGQQVSIVAVTKTHGPEAVTAAYAAGIQDVGENRVQEALSKMPDVEVPVKWHLIGHLQRNKVKALESFDLFHALDSVRLADAIDRFGRDRGKPVDVLVQVNPAREETKGGFDLEEVSSVAERLAAMSGLRVTGAMTIARLEADETELRETFASVRETGKRLAAAGHPATQLSMGMSGDFEIALEEGATIVRLGTILFGAREQ